MLWRCFENSKSTCRASLNMLSHDFQKNMLRQIKGNNSFPFLASTNLKETQRVKGAKRWSHGRVLIGDQWSLIADQVLRSRIAHAVLTDTNASVLVSTLFATRVYYLLVDNWQVFSISRDQTTTVAGNELCLLSYSRSMQGKQYSLEVLR